jgi:hypothetical protein
MKFVFILLGAAQRDFLEDACKSRRHSRKKYGSGSKSRRHTDSFQLRRRWGYSTAAEFGGAGV